MPSPHASSQTPVSPPGESNLCLVITQGPRRGTSVPLDHFPFLVGRDLRSNLRLLDVQVSRLHCIFSKRHGCVSVQDMGSRNGTLVNSRKIVDSVEVAPGDLLIVGRTTLRVEVLLPESTNSQEETIQTTGQTRAISSSTGRDPS